MTAKPLLVLLLLAGPVTEPAARPAQPLPLRMDPAIARVSGARELPDGRVLVSDAKKPSVYLLDPKTGRALVVGSAGAGERQYVQPGGFYAGPGDTTLLLDRSQKRVLTLSREGRIAGSASIAVRGTQSSSDRDVDYERPDAQGHAYFMKSRFAPPGGPNAQTLLRFDPVTQTSEPVAQIGLPEEKTFPGGDGMTFGRTVIGSPADGWGVTPDGRVAVVRAAPYRVEWHLPGGRIVQGPVVEYDAIPMTETDRKAFAEKAGRGGAFVGQSGAARGAAADPGMLFAPTKAPFDPEAVRVSPDGRVWVKRSAAASATTVVYDVFDAAGRRTARLAFPAASHLVGFGPSSVYVREIGPDGAVTLKKYSAA